ncbi:hypothetical protein F1B92_02815 [Campylobacter sp. FMV-PI01]|uniref:TPM domain-containing protein n=1 Tax=Campylobacter portucalensis TaxID=2608384 RepID=A0A6L5WH14_9BACT|nr:hypothetical protein [Campylobacter portucalensis]MSN96136.1 hypothetical protein [Campylobacter portucalensis]
MNKIFLGALCTLFFKIGLFANSVVLENEGILKEHTIEKMQIIGDELHTKTGVYLGICAVKNLGNLSLNEKAYEISKELKEPYVFLIIATENKKINIYTSSDVALNKDEILSPFPNKGSIIPLLVSVKKGQDPFNPALLNGYADMAEKIASSRGVELESNLANTNKNILNFIRIIFYGSIILVIVSGIYYKRIRKNGE